MKKHHLNLLSFRTATLTASLACLSACGPARPDSGSLNTLQDGLFSLGGDTESTEDFLVGSGIGDITGPASGLATAGYAAPAPKTAGIHQRLWARGLVLAEKESEDRRIVLVTADLCYITGLVKDAVIKKLQDRFGDRYRHDNVLIAATHPHSGPAGFGQHGMYNTPSGGFSRENFEIIVAGIVTAIAQADGSLQTGSVDMIAGTLTGANRNRSLPAFELNPAALKAELPRSVDESVTMLKLSAGGRPVGLQHWYATHGTSMNKLNALISGDNKGYAAWKFEQKMQQSGFPGFVAAFANSNAGDASPNTDGDVDNDGDWECVENNNFACTRISGEKQYSSALHLFNEQGRSVGRGIRSVLKFIDMSEVKLDSSDTGLTSGASTCAPAIGVSMLAGSEEDGPGVGREGVSCENGGPLIRRRCEAERLSCHGNKPVVIPTEDVGRYGFTARIVPVQLITIGKLALAGVPAEMTSMAGHLLKKSLLADLSAQGIERVVVAAYANEYSNYITTRDEYQAQHYEGASTLFGEWTLAAYQKIFRELAAEISIRSGSHSGILPLYSSEGLMAAKQRRGIDRAPRGTAFGDTVADVKRSYRRGETVSVSFQGSNLNNNMQSGGSFFTIEKRSGNSWQAALDDDDFYTRLHWTETRGAQSQVRIEWDTQPDTDRGEYRIRFKGRAVSLLAGPQDYEAVSAAFQVE